MVKNHGEGKALAHVVCPRFSDKGAGKTMVYTLIFLRDFQGHDHVGMSCKNSSRAPKDMLELSMSFGGSVTNVFERSASYTGGATQEDLFLKAFRLSM